MKKILSLLPILFVVCSTQAQSLLWKVSGKGMEKPSYLYGTIHIQDQRVFSFDTIVVEKLLECDAFAMEILMDEIDQEAIKENMLMKDKTLKDLISTEDYAFLDSLFKIKLGQGIFFFDKMKPFFISSQLMQVDMSKEMTEPLDMYFLKIARKNGKKAYGVEKFEDQIGAIDKISLEEQAKMLIESARDTATESMQFDDLLEVYLNGDIEKMPEMSADTTMPDNFMEDFLTSRNHTMAKNSIKLFKKHPTFVAVGAAHLAGEEGVLELIRKKGYTVEPIKFNFRNQ